MRLLKTMLLIVAVHFPLSIKASQDDSYQDQKSDLSSDSGDPVGGYVVPASEAEPYYDPQSGCYIDPATGTYFDMDTGEHMDTCNAQQEDTGDGWGGYDDQPTSPSDQQNDYIEDTSSSNLDDGTSSTEDSGLSTSGTSTSAATPDSSNNQPQQPQTIQVSAVCRQSDGAIAKLCGASTTDNYCLIQEIDFDVVLDPLFNNVQRSIVCAPGGGELTPGNYRFQFDASVTQEVTQPSSGTDWGNSNNHTISKLRVDSYVTAIDNFMTGICGARQLSIAQLIALGGSTYDANNAGDNSTTGVSAKLYAAQNMQGSIELLPQKPSFVVARAPFLVSHGSSNSGKMKVSVGNSWVDRGNPCSSNSNITDLSFRGYTITSQDLGSLYHSDSNAEVLLTRVNIHGPDASELLVGSNQVPGLQEFMHLTMTNQVFYKVNPFETFFRAPYGTWVDNNKMLSYILAWARKNSLNNQFAALLQASPRVLADTYSAASGYGPSVNSWGALTVPSSLQTSDGPGESIFETAKEAAARFYYKYYDFQTSYQNIYQQRGSGGAQSDSAILAYDKLLTHLTMDPDSFIFDTRNIQDKNAASVLVWPIRRADIVTSRSVPNFYLPLTFEVPQVYTDVKSVGHDYQDGTWSVDQIQVFGTFGDLRAEFVPRIPFVTGFDLDPCPATPLTTRLSRFVEDVQVSGSSASSLHSTWQEDQASTLTVSPVTAFCLPAGPLGSVADNGLFTHPGDIFVYPREVSPNGSITQITDFRSLGGLVARIPVSGLLRGYPTDASSAVETTVRYPVSILSQLANPPHIIPISHTRVWTRLRPKRRLARFGAELRLVDETNTVTSRVVTDTYEFYRNADPSTSLISCTTGTSDFMNATKTYHLTVGIETTAMKSLTDSSSFQHTGNESHSVGQSGNTSNTYSISGSAGLFGGKASASGSEEISYKGGMDLSVGGGTNTSQGLRTAFSTNNSSSSSNSSTLTLSVPSSTSNTLSLWQLGRCAVNTRIYTKHVVTKGLGRDGEQKTFYNAGQQHLLATGRLYQTEPRNDGGTTDMGVPISGFRVQPLDISHHCSRVLPDGFVNTPDNSQLVLPTCFYSGL